MLNKSLKYWIWLNSLPEVGAVRARKLIELFMDPELLWKATSSEIFSIPFINDALKSAILNRELKARANEHFKLLNSKGISVVPINHSDYPGILRKIYDPPVLLYVNGTLSDEELSIAVVGSRRASSYGLGLAEYISRELAGLGITIVSGLATGIDSTAHKGAINAGGRTVAVLGSGIDIVYPPENKGLYEQVTHHGAVISEFTPGFPPIPSNFPSRNRIISGLSAGVVVIEANERSGSLITANFAIEQGREVFAVPGNINNYNSKGTNNLLKDGAKIVTCIDDILEEVLSFKNLYRSIQDDKAAISNKPQTNALGLEENKIIDILKIEPMHIDMLANKCGLDIRTVNSLVTLLEVSGLVELLPGKVLKLNDKFTAQW